MRGAHRDVWCSKIQRLIEAELFAAERRRPAPSGRALLCAAVYAREIQGITATYKLKNARNRAPVTPVSLHISDVSAQRRVWGVKRGKGTIGALSPLVSAGRARHSSAVGTASPGRRRRPLRTLTPSVKSPSAARRCIGGIIPSAEGKEKRLRTGVRSLAVFSASAD